MSNFSFESLATGLKAASAAADVLVGNGGGGENSITIRHAGFTVSAPYEGNENKTVLEIIREFGTKLGIPGSVQPSVTSPGAGSVDIESKVEAGKTYDAFTDKKENALAA